MNKLYFLLILICFISSTSAKAQTFYDINTIQKIEITFSQPNWDYILDTAKQGSDTYTMAQLVRINGIDYDSVGVKYKGNSSYNPNNAKNPFHIEMDHFKNQNHDGFNDIKLSNGFNEPSFIRETLIYKLVGNYMHAPRANYAQVYVNGGYMGLYTNVEAVTKRFVDAHFYSKDNSFFYADYGGCNFVYKGPDSSLYFQNYTLKSDFGWNDLTAFCNTLKNNIVNIETVLDVDRALWMLALTNSMVILDSYLGAPSHNFYIYQDHNGRFNPIIWDLNGGLGVFNSPGAGPGYNVAQMQNMSPVLHINDSLWPLVNKLLNVPRYKKMYIAHMQTIMNENFVNGSYITTGTMMQSVADTAVQSDQNKFFSYAQFISNLNNNVVSGPKTIPGITLLMNTRTNFLLATPEFQQMPPSVSAIQSSNNNPPINSSVFITANVTNATNVFLGLRNSVMEKFNRMQMFDDGLHGDGAAGDNVYGISVTITVPEIQYYIYAENNNAGLFAPPRAEHEYYTLNSNYITVFQDDVTINELMAINNTTVQNASGSYSDWIELYNNTTNDLSLDYLSLSDDINNLSKWSFPLGIIIPAGGFQIVWADNDSGTGELHCGFKLSGNGENVYLSYPGSIISSTGFGVQNADISFGRFPNGTGPYVTMQPTFNTYNTITGIELPFGKENSFVIYPNPSTGKATLEWSTIDQNIELLEIFDLSGRIVLSKEINSSEYSLQLNFNLNKGVYFCRISGNDSIGKVVKLIVN